MSGSYAAYAAAPAGGYSDAAASGSGYSGTSGVTNTSGGGFLGNLLTGVAPSLVRGAIGAGAQLLGTGLTTAANNQAADTASAATIQAAQIQADANEKATQEVLVAQQQARDEFRAASQRGLGDIDTGVTNYAGTISPLLTPAPITQPTYRDETTQQQTGEADLLRNANAQLAASGLRGAGRAGIGAVLDQDRRFQEDTRAANDADTIQAKRAAQTVANTARTGLAQVQAQAGGSKANTELLTGNQLGASLQAGGNTASNLTSNTGATTGNAVSTAGNINANADTANGASQASALGNIAGAFTSPYTLGAGTPNSPGFGGAGSYKNAYPSYGSV